MNAQTTDQPTIVITGGAGYLGRTVAHWLWERGFAPVCLDNFSTSRPFSHPGYPCLEVDLTDKRAVEQVWQTFPNPLGVLHFAARALVTESLNNPGLYLSNNTAATIHVAEQAVRSGAALIHSSSCAVYGIPDAPLIGENTPLCPVSPYGESKRLCEMILDCFSRHQGLRVIHLRYFNPAGAVEGAGHGERHEPETHLLPNVVSNALKGAPVSVFGTDYPTPDGTCIRDFIHVADLAEGHQLALSSLIHKEPGYRSAINLGSGCGFSVKQVIETAGDVLGQRIDAVTRPRRPGDPPRLIADTASAEKALGFRPTRTLAQMIRSHADWIQSAETML